MLHLPGKNLLEAGIAACLPEKSPNVFVGLHVLGQGPNPDEMDTQVAVVPYDWEIPATPEPGLCESPSPRLASKATILGESVVDQAQDLIDEIDEGLRQPTQPAIEVSTSPEAAEVSATQHYSPKSPIPEKPSEAAPQETPGDEKPDPSKHLLACQARPVHKSRLLLWQGV